MLEDVSRELLINSLWLYKLVNYGINRYSMVDVDQPLDQVTVVAESTMVWIELTTNY